MKRGIALAIPVLVLLAGCTASTVSPSSSSVSVPVSSPVTSASVSMAGPRQVRTISLAAPARNMVVSGNVAYVVEQGEYAAAKRLVAIDLEKGITIFTATVGADPHIAVEGSTVWVANRADLRTPIAGADTLQHLDATGHELERRIIPHVDAVIATDAGVWLIAGKPARLTHEGTQQAYDLPEPIASGNCGTDVWVVRGNSNRELWQFPAGVKRPFPLASPRLVAGCWNGKIVIGSMGNDGVRISVDAGSPETLASGSLATITIGPDRVWLESGEQSSTLVWWEGGRRSPASRLPGIVSARAAVPGGVWLGIDRELQLWQ